ncbi:MAG: Hsp33 family molecular chaperone HslO, partial [Gammaproteobacteria bacterium]
MSVVKDGDTLRRFVFENEDILGTIVRLDSSWGQLQATDEYPPQIMSVLGEAAAATALLGRSLKFDGRLTFQLQGAEHLRLMVLQANNQLQLRGLARYGDHLPEQFADLVDGATLTVTVESGRDAE